MPGPSVQLYQTAYGVVDSIGKITLSMQGPPLNRVWQGTLSIIGSVLGVQFTVSIGNQASSIFFAPGPAGPYQLLHGQTISLTATGLISGTSYTAVFVGVDDPSEGATPYVGPIIAASGSSGAP